MKVYALHSVQRTLVLGSALLLAPWVIHAQATNATPTPPLLVTTAVAKSDPVQQTFTGTGTAVALSSVTIHARVDGQLESVQFEEGQSVRAGQVLAQLDPRTYQALLDQAKATKAKDEATLANAQADLKRYQNLIKDDATTQQVLDTQTALVNQLSATVQSDTAQVSYATVQLAYTTITAPISGRVGARLIDPGNIVHASDSSGLVVINQVDPIGLQFSVPERHLQTVQHAVSGGQKQRLKVDAIDRNTNQVLGSGELVLVNNQIDTTSGTVLLKARIHNTNTHLWPGQSVNARLHLATLNDVVTIPAAAVQRSQNGMFVWLVGKDDTVRNQAVSVTQIEGQDAIIGKGLKSGDRVVADGFYRMVPGAHIKEAAAAAAAAAPAGAKP